MKPNNCVSLSLKIKIKLVIVRAMFLGQFCPSGKDDLKLTLSKAPTVRQGQTTTPGTTCP